MGLKAAATGGGGGNRVPQENIDPGSYPARVVSVVDLGVQTQRPYKGQPKPPCQMIRVTYELTDVFMKDEDGNEIEDKPRWIAEDFKLLPMDADLAVSTKRYKTIDPKNEYDGDWSELLGKGVMVAIVNNEGKDGKVYDNIGGTSVMRQRDMDRLEELKNDPYFFDLQDPNPEVWKKIPQWLQERIQENINYEGSKLQEMAGKAPAKAAKADEPKKGAKNVKRNANGDADGADDDAGDNDVAGEDAPW